MIHVAEHPWGHQRIGGWLSMSIVIIVSSCLQALVTNGRWDQSLVIPGSIEDLLLWWSGGKLKSWVFKMWKIAPLVVLWSVWKMRNECLFKVAQTNFEVLCEKVKVQIAFWTKVNMEVDYSIHDIVSNLHQIRFSS